MLVGGRTKLAIECVQNDKNKEMGNLFFILNGVRFGNDNFEYEVEWCLLNLKHGASVTNEFPEVFAIPFGVIFESQQAVFSDTSNRDQCPLDRYFPGYWDDPGEINDKIFFYGGAYLFDGFSVIMVVNDISMRLAICDRETGVAECIDVKRNELFDLLVQLERKYLEQIG